MSLQDDEMEVTLGSLHLAPTEFIPAYELSIDRRNPLAHGSAWAQQFQHCRERATAASTEDCRYSQLNGASLTASPL